MFNASAVLSHTSAAESHMSPPHRLIPCISDEALAVVMPVAAYWIYSVAFHFIMKTEIPFFEKYRIHTLEEMETKNKVSLYEVLRMVLVQQVLQTILGIMVLPSEQPVLNHQIAQQIYANRIQHWLQVIFASKATVFTGPETIQWIAYLSYWVIVPACQLSMAMFILDTHQYFLHRLFHVNQFLYKHIHSHHHRLYVTYAFGALYNHPIEGFLLDSVGASMAFSLSGMSPRMGLLFFTFSSLKTVDDHCGYAFPWDPLQFLFGNNVVYHDIHHQQFGIKTNYSQPFFICWDKWLGTMVSDEAVKKYEDKRAKLRSVSKAN
ncbi:Sphingolipid C4-hydroxylase sur2 [Umbelopsis sp. WA50703]